MNVGFGGHASPFGFITRKQLGRMAISHVLYVANRRLLCIAGNAGKENRDSAAFCRYCGVSMNMATKNEEKPKNDQLNKRYCR